MVTPLNDDYEFYDNGKCILESSAEGGHVLIRLGNDESLGRELRTYLQTEKYLSAQERRHPAESTKRILREFAEDNQERRAAARHAARRDARRGRLLRRRASRSSSRRRARWRPWTRLEYLDQEHVHQDGLPQAPEPPNRCKEIQAILRSNDIGQQTLALELDEGNTQAIDDVRNYVALMAGQNKQIVLHDMIEKRYSLRPYGWPDDEVLLLVARLLVLGEISLMMDGALVPIDKAYEAHHDPGQAPQDHRSSSGRRPIPRRSRTPAAWARNCSTRWGRTARTPCSPSCRTSSRAGRPA